MNKVICDVCGTSYPATSAKCPICGSVNVPPSQSVSGNTEQVKVRPEPRRAAVKGGKYSSANVRKRNKQSAAGKAAGQETAAVQSSGKKNPDRTDRILVTIAWILVVAILIVIGYVVVRYFLPSFGSKNPGTDTTGSTGSVSTTTQSEPIETTDPKPSEIACTALSLSVSSVEFDAEGQALLLNAKAEPADTTDEVLYFSSDTSVATVTNEGRVMAIGPGQAVITVQCGAFEAICEVNCSFAPETTAPPETTEPEETTAPTETEVFELNREEFMLFSAGESHKLYTGPLSLSQISWSSSDPSVAKVENGLVTAVSPGTVVITGEYNGMKRNCTVYCYFEEDDSSDSTTEADDGGFNTGIGEDTGGEGSGDGSGESGGEEGGGDIDDGAVG